jgi:hypothetical protein
MKPLLILILFLSFAEIECPAQNSLHNLTINSKLIDEHTFDSLLNGTWYETSNGYTTFLLFNHHLLFQYKGKGDNIVWDGRKQIYSVNGPIDTLFYKAFKLNNISRNTGMCITFEKGTTSHVICNEEFGCVYFGCRYFNTDTLLLACYSPITKSAEAKCYCRLPPQVSLQQLSDSLGFTNKAEAKNLMVNEKKEGKWIEYFKGGAIIKDSLSLSKMLQSDTTGDPLYLNKPDYYEFTLYKHDKPIGIVRKYNLEGELMEEIPYVNGKRDGMHKTYYKGKLFAEIQDSAGSANGIEKRYYLNGKVMSETIYINGVAGSTKNYDQNGNEIKK